GRSRLSGNPGARQLRTYDIERVLRLSAMCHWIRQRLDALQLLDDRARPSVRDDNGQRVLFFRAHVNEMNVDAVDVGYELRQRLQLRLALAPFVILPPVTCEFLHRSELHALRLIYAGFFFRPTRGRNAPAQIIERGLRHDRDDEWPDRG